MDHSHIVKHTLYIYICGGCITLQPDLKDMNVGLVLSGFICVYIALTSVRLILIRYFLGFQPGKKKQMLVFVLFAYGKPVRDEVTSSGRLGGK